MNKDKYSEYKIEDNIIMKYYGNGGDVIIPEGVKDLFFESFSDDIFTSIVIPGSILEITILVFEGLKALKKVTINEGVKVVGFGSFRNCLSLETIFLPKSLILIERKAFEGCSSLKEIYYSGTKRIGN